MYTFGHRVLLLVLVLAAGLFPACRRPPAPSTEPVTVWRPLGAWSGRGLLQTDSFISDTGELRIVWEARAAAGEQPGNLRVTVHSAVSGRPLVQAVDHRGPGRATSFVNEDPRSFFLVIEASNLEWSVEVAEGVAGVRKGSGIRD